MRGFPKTISTAKDVENLAWSLPTDQAKGFLDTMDPEFIKTIFEPGFFEALKVAVAAGRWPDPPEDQRLKNEIAKASMRQDFFFSLKSDAMEMMKEAEAGLKIAAEDLNNLRLQLANCEVKTNG